MIAAAKNLPALADYADVRALAAEMADQKQLASNVEGPNAFRRSGTILPQVEAVVGALLSAFKPRASLVAENLALRQQLAALRREVRAA